MIRRPPRSTRTDTLFPYTTLFRSLWRQTLGKAGKRRVFGVGAENNDSIPLHALPDRHAVFIDETLPSALVGALRCLGEALDNMTHPVPDSRRSEERSVGKECVSPCRSRWSPYT